MRLSPPITPTKYSRPDDESDRPIIIREYAFDGLDHTVTTHTPDVERLKGNSVVHHSDMGEVYVIDNQVMVGGTIYDTTPMLVLRERALDTLVYLDDSGIIDNLQMVSERAIDPDNQIPTDERTGQ